MIGRFFPSKEVEENRPQGFHNYETRLGDLMRGERATLGKSLLDVQRELKIKATYVAAIENADPSAFESPSFIAGYVRSYARYLGLDPEWAFDAFCQESSYVTAHGMSAQASSAAATKAERKAQLAKDAGDPYADPNASFVPRGEAMFSGFEPGAIGSIMVLVALIGGIGYGGWLVLQEVQRVQFAPIEQAPGVTATLDPLAAGDTVFAEVEQSSGYSTPNPDALDRLYRPQALDVPVMVARDGPIAALDPQDTGALLPEISQTSPEGTLAVARAETDETPVAALPIQVVETDVPEVSIFAVRPAWVQVKAADGRVIFEKVLDAGEKYTLPQTEKPPVLRTGYGGAVYFAVNGQTYGPAGEGASVVKNIELAQEALQSSYSLADLSQNKELARVVADLAGQ